MRRPLFFLSERRLGRLAAPVVDGTLPSPAMDKPPAIAPDDAPRELRLFGAAVALRAGQPLRLARKSVALLAYIALAGPTTRTRVADVFWGALDNASARRNLRRELHRLGEVQAANWVVSDGERLSLAAGTVVDVPAFEHLLPGSPAEALPLYAGPLLDGLEVADAPAFTDWLAHERERLAALRRGALQAELARHEGAGRPRQALEYALALLAADPLQEAHYADAMRLCYAVGERARALELFERCRATLRDELGLDPLPATTALAEHIRAAERLAPIVAHGGVRDLARFDASLVGRASQLAALRACATPLALIEGEPGVGKSRLAAEYALDHKPLLQLRGSAVWRGAPLHAVTELVQRALDDPALRATLHALPADDRAQLARLVPALAAVPADDTSAPARAQFFAALTRGLDALLADGVLVADDVQWLDEATLEALEALAKRPAPPAAPPSGLAARALAVHPAPPPRTGARIVFTARSAELAEAPATREMLRRLQRAGLLTQLTLAPLDDGATLQLVRELSGTAGGQRFAGRLQRATSGNPFFMLETIRYLFDIGELRVGPGGEWSTPYDDATADYAELPVPPTVHKAVAERIERLGPAARRLLETAALAGDSFTLADLRPATALAERDALEALERALQAQLLMPADDAYRFVHDLGRAAVDGEVRPERRRLIHRRLAATLQERRGAPDRIGQHLEAAGERSEAVAWRLRAAADAERRFARNEVIAHLQAALADGASGAQAVEVRLALIKARRALGPQALADNAAEFEAIDAELATLDDDALRMRTDLLRTMFLMDNGRHDQALRLIEQVLAQPYAREAPPHDQCRALYMAAHCAAFSGDAPLAVRYGERGRALALTHDAPDLTSIETALTYAYVATDRAEEAVALADLALARLARRPLDEPVFRANLLAAGADAHMATGRFASAQAMLEQALELLQQSNMGGHIQMPVHIALALLHAKNGNLPAAQAARLGLLSVVGDDPSPRVRYMTAMVDASIELLEGKIADALRSLGRAIDVAVAAGNSTYQLNARLLRARVYDDLLDLDAACADADAAVDAVRAAHGSGSSGPVLIREALHAAAEIARGDPAAAQARLRAALTSERFVDDHAHESRDFARVVLAEAIAAGGDVEGALRALPSRLAAPASKARAVGLRVRLKATGAAEEAEALLASGTLAPLAEQRLQEAVKAKEVDAAP
jgi:DNA-binding SARP family transcriptional activator